MLSRAKAKRRKTGGSEAAPTVQEPEKSKPASPVPHAEPTEAREEAPADGPQPYEPADHDTVAPASPPQADFQTPSSPAAKNVTLTGAGYQSPSHVLTRHSGEAKESSPEKVDFAFPSLEKMSTDDLHAGYLNRLSASHNMERKLVGLMKSKFEVLLLFMLSLYSYVAPKSRLSRSTSKPGLSTLIIFKLLIPVAPKDRVNIYIVPVLVLIELIQV